MRLQPTRQKFVFGTERKVEIAVIHLHQVANLEDDMARMTSQNFDIKLTLPVRCMTYNDIIFIKSLLIGI